MGAIYKKWFNSKNWDERYDYLYTPQESEPIAQSLKAMAKRSTRRAVKKAIAATNNHYKGHAAIMRLI